MLFEPGFDIGVRQSSGHVDLPRLREGGMDALFFSIYVPGDTEPGLAVRRALLQIDRVREAARRYPDELVLATSVADIRRAAAGQRIAALLGMEGGHMIDNDLGLLRLYAALGVRYLTLTHNVNTPWADAAADKPAHDGLTDFGREVVRELNRLGVMVDVSHVADATFRDVLETTRVPVIASHSSCRAIANHPRNLSDEMLRALANNGGVAMINFYVDFISEEFRAGSGRAAVQPRFDAAEKACGEDEVCKLAEDERLKRAAMASGELPAVHWQKIVDHIEHAVRVAGIDHVGLGSDFDGAAMPIGMEDASQLPKITAELLRRGHAQADVEKILGGNLLRVWSEVERVGRELRAGG
jgi:membrane dipeptidase